MDFLMAVGIVHTEALLIPFTPGHGARRWRAAIACHVSLPALPDRAKNKGAPDPAKPGRCALGGRRRYFRT